MHRKQAWSKRVRKERQKKKYLTRMQATRLLQLDSIQFRRLCILKGIYPRALTRSKQKQSGNEKQYYLAREIKWLVRDHLQERAMAFRAWEKKVKRAEAMGRQEDLKLLTSDRVRPKHSLVATIKERYPYFMDAIKDIDDALSMISLYAFLSPEVHSKSTIETHHALTSGLHERAKQIYQQWYNYVARAQILTKGFISIKGYYFEAVVKGERIRWLSPHEYANKFPPGIQQYILLSFLEFYIELMRFVLFKLENDLKRDLEEREKQDDEGIDTNTEDFKPTESAIVVTDVSGMNTTSAKEKQDAQSKVELLSDELKKIRTIFNGLTFFISREVPMKHTRLIVEACGGRVATAYVPANLTHVVIDRPTLPPGMEREMHLEYIQPQYLFDCLNARVLLPVEGYRIGEELPPHISPFTVSISGNASDTKQIDEVRKLHPKILPYVPQRVHEIRKLLDPKYIPEDPDGKLADLEDQDLSDDGEHIKGPDMDAADDVALSDDDEVAQARRVVPWEEEEVTETVQRSKLSALKVKKQRELNLMNAPTNEVVAKRRQALLKAKEKKSKEESSEERLKRKIAQAKKEDAATRKMQLQVARKKAARYYKMVNGIVEGAKKKAEILGKKAKQIEEGKIKKNKDGSGLVNTRVEAKRQRAEKAGRKLTKRKADNPYKKLPKWVQ